MLNFFKNFFIKNKKNNFIKAIEKHLEWEINLIKKLFPQELKKIKFPNLKQLKYFPYLLNKKEKKIVIFLTGLIILSLTILLVRFYFKLPLKPAYGGEYTEGMMGQPRLINPLYSSLNYPDADLVKLIFSGLVKWRDGKIVPDLAEKWEKDKEEKIYTFYLRKGIFWHDNQELTADDIVFTVETIQDKKTNSPFRESLINLKIKKIDRYTIQFLLETPHSYFENFLTFGILPKHLWEKIPTENFISRPQNLSPIGSGPFKLKSLLKDNEKIKKIVLERNKKYYFQSPYLKKINFRFFDNLEEALDALRTKKIDGFAYLGKNQEKIEYLPKTVNSYHLPLSYYTVIFLNQEKELISSKKFRQALILALDRKKIIEEIVNGELINTPIIYPQFTLKDKNYEFSIEKAKKILKEGKFIKRNRKSLEISLTLQNQPRYKKIGELIKESWEKIGLKTNLEILEKEDFEKVIKERNYDAILYSIIEGYDPDPFPLWHSSQIKNGLNLSNFKDIKVDALIEKLRIISNEEERKKYYHQFQEIIFDEVPAIFLYQLNLDYFQDKKIKGFKQNYFPFLSDRFSEIENWYIYTKRGKK